MHAEDMLAEQGQVCPCQGHFAVIILNYDDDNGDEPFLQQKLFVPGMTADSTSNFNGIVDTFLDVLDDKCKDHVCENFPILRLGKLCLYKSNRTTMRPLGIYPIGISIYRVSQKKVSICIFGIIKTTQNKNIFVIQVTDKVLSLSKF